MWKWNQRIGIVPDWIGGVLWNEHLGLLPFLSLLLVWELIIEIWINMSQGSITKTTPTSSLTKFRGKRKENYFFDEDGDCVVQIEEQPCPKESRDLWIDQINQLKIKQEKKRYFWCWWTKERILCFLKGYYLSMSVYLWHSHKKRA